jgi:hypothetical protein
MNMNINGAVGKPACRRRRRCQLPPTATDDKSEGNCAWLFERVWPAVAISAVPSTAGKVF